MDDARQQALPGVPDDEFEKDPAEQEALARDLGADLTDLFVDFIRGELDFAEVSFATYDVLQDLHIVATGAYELVEDDDDEDEDDEDDDEERGDEAAQDPAEGSRETVDADLASRSDGDSEQSVTEEQEDLAQEPARN